MSVVIQLAEAVVEHLNAGSFSQAFTAQRHYLPTYKREELTQLKVAVVPKSLTSEADTNDTNEGEYAVDVGVNKAVTPGALAEVDALMTLVEEITDSLDRADFELEDVEATWLKTANDPIYAPDHLDQKHVFTSVLTITYRIRR